MMDVSLPSLVLRLVADLRPSADAAATAGIDRPPSAVALGPVVAPASLAQEALVAQGSIGPSIVASVAAPEHEPPGFSEAPKRVLKPWGVPMLPADEESPGGSAATGPGPGASADRTRSPTPG